jgi:5-methylcytosine-specific restriction endonuclease McrA
VATASDPEIYQVIVHVGTDALPPADPVGVPAETPQAPSTPGHSADPARCHVEDGPAISITTAQMITCTAALSWLLHDRDGTALDAGRRRRRPTSAQRRAARDRDHGRCRYPGCESRRTDLHHIQYWSNGGRTSLDNLINLCKHHHMLVHDRGYLIAAGPGGAFTFYRPDGTLLPSCPALPDPDGTIGDCHDADITPDTIVPAWYGERLDLDYAIHACFANADYQARQSGCLGAGQAQTFGCFVRFEPCPAAYSRAQPPPAPVIDDGQAHGPHPNPAGLNVCDTRRLPLLTWT